MKIHNLEITEVILRMRKSGNRADNLTAMKLLKWQANKHPTSCEIEENDKNVIDRYIELRDKWLGGPIRLVYKRDCVRINKCLLDEISDTFRNDPAAGRELMKKWLVWHNWYDKGHRDKFITADECQIVDQEVYDMVQTYKQKFLIGGK